MTIFIKPGSMYIAAAENEFNCQRYIFYNWINNKYLFVRVTSPHCYKCCPLLPAGAGWDRWRGQRETAGTVVEKETQALETRLERGKHVYRAEKPWD